MLMHRMSSTSDMTASAYCAEASFPCARSAAAHTASLMMDAIITASIIIFALAIILRFALGLLGSVLLVAVLLSVLVLLVSEGLPKSWA